MIRNITYSFTPTPQDFEALLADEQRFYAVHSECGELIVPPVTGDRLQFQGSGGRSFVRVVTHVARMGEAAPGGYWWLLSLRVPEASE